MIIEIGKLKIIPIVVKEPIIEYKEGPVHRFEDHFWNLNYFFKKQYNEKLGDYRQLYQSYDMAIALFGNVILYTVETKTTHYTHDTWKNMVEEIKEKKEFYIYMPNFCSNVQIEYINQFFNELKAKGFNRGASVVLTLSEQKGRMKDGKMKKGSINELKKFIAINSNFEEIESLQENPNVKKRVKKSNNNIDK